jgi:hypothetical protein
LNCQSDGDDANDSFSVAPQRPVEQTFPQPPQLSGSVDVSAQAPLHTVKPGGHTHWEFSQLWPDAQVWPHRPQLFPSEVVSTQAPSHSV